jgi:lambda family phage portal protein
MASRIKNAWNAFRGKSEVTRPKASFFEGAAQTRFTSDWVTRNASLDTLLETNLVRLRSRSKSLCQNDGYAANAAMQFVQNVVGESGFRIKVRAQNKRGGIDKRASRAIEQAWNDFCKAQNFTVTGDITEHQFDTIMVRSIFTMGGALARMVRGFSGNRYRFALQGIAMERLDPELFDHSRRIFMSVEKDEFGAVRKYHVLSQHPGDRWMNGVVKGPRDEYDAKDIIHPFIREEFSQSQGKPLLSPVISRLRQLHGYEEAELIAARAHASKLGFFISDFDSPAGGYQGEGQDSYGNIKMDGSPGTFENLPPGVRPEIIDPTHPNQNLPGFRKAMLQGVAAGLAISYPLLGSDLEGVNYSSIRQGTLSERDMWKLIQRWYIDEVKKPIFYQWLEMALMSGQLEYDMTDYNRMAYCEFQGRRWEWIDPDKDSRAEDRRLKNRLTSHQRIARGKGEDIDEILDEIEQDNQAARDRQLDLFLDLQGIQPEQGDAEE